MVGISTLCTAWMPTGSECTKSAHYYHGSGKSRSAPAPMAVLQPRQSRLPAIASNALHQPPQTRHGPACQQQHTLQPPAQPSANESAETLRSPAHVQMLAGNTKGKAHNTVDVSTQLRPQRPHFESNQTTLPPHTTLSPRGGACKLSIAALGALLLIVAPPAAARGPSCIFWNLVAARTVHQRL